MYWNTLLRLLPLLLLFPLYNCYGRYLAVSQSLADSAWHTYSHALLFQVMFLVLHICHHHRSSQLVVFALHVRSPDFPDSHRQFACIDLHKSSISVRVCVFTVWFLHFLVIFHPSVVFNRVAWTVVDVELGILTYLTVVWFITQVMASYYLLSNIHIYLMDGNEQLSLPQDRT